MELGLRGRIVAITGAGSGIGEEMARAFAEEGAHPVLLDIDEAAVAGAAEKIRARDRECTALGLDVTNIEAVEGRFADLRAEHGRIDVLVNNAGFPRDAFLTKMSVEAWSSVLDVVLNGAFNCTRSVLPVMMDAKHGRIINISSRAHLGNPGQANYSAAKAGLIGFTRAIALECGKFDITCNAIAPGLVATPLITGRDDYEELSRRFAANTPIRRVGEPRDIASAALFLASDLAGYITGETLHVTGGRYG